MPGKRSGFEIDLCILGVLGRGPCGLTKLMYRTNLCWRKLRERLSYLMDRGFVSEASVSRRRRVYHITEKGREALGHLHKLENLLGRPQAWFAT